MTTLKLQNRRWYPFIFLTTVSAVAVYLLHPKLGNKPELLLPAFGAIAGFIFFLYRQHLDETKLFKDLFVQFNERYDKMKDGLNEIVDGTLKGEPSEAQRKLLFSYLNLCSEEYLFYKAGYIDHEVWESWRSGMEDVFKRLRDSEFWKTEQQNGSYYGFKLK
jgi:hypothetical protein